MVEKEKDLIGFAHKVISFRMNVIKACKAKGITPPTDEQISDYINDYGLHFFDFMADFTEHEGMFRCRRTPLEDFKQEVNGITWGSNKPTEEEVLEFFNKNGNNISLFCQQHTIKEMSPFERKVYFSTIDKLTEEELVKLWNMFIEESAIYGTDSYIIDLWDEEDGKYLDNTLFADDADGSMAKLVSDMVNKEHVRFIQWFWSSNDNDVHAVKDVKGVITAYWSEIFERIVEYPSCYLYIGVVPYFEECVWKSLLNSLNIC